MTEQNQVAPAAPTAVAIPQRGRGFDDDVDQGDFLIPRAKVVTFTSLETKNPDESKRIPAGRFINSVSKVELPKEFVPIMRYKNYVKWNPLDTKSPNYDPNFEPGKMIFATRDRHDPRVIEGIAWGEKGEKPIVQKILNYLCYFKGQNFPLILSFKSTSYKGAQRLNTLLEAAEGDMFSNRYKLVITMDTKAGNSYYVMNVEGSGKSSDEELAICEGIYNRFGGKDVESMAHHQEDEKTEEVW